jgi:hypothetical protein
MMKKIVPNSASNGIRALETRAGRLAGFFHFISIKK